MNIIKTTGKLPLLAAAVLVLIANVEAQSSLSDGLLAYYPFSGNAEDATGNGHDGVVMDAVLTTNRFGQTNSAYAFEGTNSAIVVSNSAALQPLGNFSVSVWAVVQKAPVSRYQPIPLLADGYWSFVVVPPNSVSPSNTGLGLTLAEDPLNFFPVGINIPTNRWFQAIFTFQHTDGNFQDGFGVVSFYLNGVLVEQGGTQLFESNDGNPALFLGAASPRNLGYPGHFGGLLDDIRIYDRTLSSNEVQQLYAEEAVPPVQPQVDTHKAIHLEFSQLTVGAEYQLQFSRNRHRWLDAGAPFTAAATTVSQYMNADHYNAKDVFWRLRVVPVSTSRRTSSPTRRWHPTATAPAVVSTMR